MKTQKQKAVGLIALPHIIMEGPYQKEHHTEKILFTLFSPMLNESNDGVLLNHVRNSHF